MKISNSEFNGIGKQLILPFFKGTEKAPNNSLAGLSRVQRGLVRDALSSGSFDGKKGKRMSLWTPDCNIILVGMGDKGSLDHKVARNTGAKLVASLSKKKGVVVTVRFTSGWTGERMLDFAEGMMLRDYEFLEHQEIPDGHIDEEWVVDFQASSRYQDLLSEKLESVRSVVGGVHLARDLGNEPANVLYPMEYARRALEWAKGKENVLVEVYDWDKLQELGMGGLINVGKGSDRKPCMVLFTLNPDADEGVQRPCIVGKGITFDTGGISIKPTSGMWDMKYDMCGAATVFGLMEALHATGYERRVNGISCLAENMPGSGAYRPGDVFKTYSGKTIEVFSTDAEGRNVLSDGLWKAGEFDPEYIVDLATLTGAVVVALGNQISGMWSNDEGVARSLENAADRSGEPVWRMPLNDQFRKYMTDSAFADIRNGSIGGRAGSSNTAAAFLEFFVPNRGFDKDGEKIPWVHLDIAGSAWGPGSKARSEGVNPLFQYGVSGVHVRTLHRLICDE
ncbi:MAG: leucyl aminopeptidase [Euryarchaeota archaeon]|nr:leucyl aminopeptidase [Euryarchaeota archaeon]|tara:strand:+ start:3286 stop:4809 length:1524 start_codon:yes stop_codon:yes gene_type:complete